MAKYEFNLDELMSDDVDENICQQIHKNAGKLQTTNHKNGRQNPNAMNCMSIGELIQGAYNYKDPAKFLAKQESVLSTSLGSVWGEIKDTPGLTDMFSGSYNEMLNELDPGKASGGGAATEESGSDKGNSGKISKDGWKFPVPPGKSTITSPFGQWRGKRQHAGIDIGVPSGSRCEAAKDGVVDALREDAEGYGWYIDIKHDDGAFYTRYAHLKERIVKAGDKVSVGDKIGLSGGASGDPGRGSSTGAHLHFEVRRTNGFGMDSAVDPESYLPK